MDLSTHVLKDNWKAIEKQLNSYNKYPSMNRTYVRIVFRICQCREFFSPILFLFPEVLWTTGHTDGRMSQVVCAFDTNARFSLPCRLQRGSFSRLKRALVSKRNIPEKFCHLCDLERYGRIVVGCLWKSQVRLQMEIAKWRKDSRITGTALFHCCFFSPITW